MTVAAPASSLDAATREALQRLADLAVPPPVPWTPQTWGWLAAAVLLAAGISGGLVRWLRRRARNRYRREALAELARLDDGLSAGVGPAQTLAAVPALLKRVALAAWPRAAVAHLAGGPWVEFLQRSGRTALPAPLSALLREEEYAREGPERRTEADVRACLRAARAWIGGHRAPA